MHSCINIANEILRLAKEQNTPLTPLKLMKMVFLSHGWMLGFYGKPLVKESIEAWQYGPVIPLLYQAIKHFRSLPVDYPLENFDLKEITEEEEELIQEVYRKYIKFSGVELSSLTHMPGSPWDITWSLYGKNVSISNDLIEDYYKKQLSHPA